MIRTDCYLAVLKKFREKFPDAHFEVITRTAKSILSPSKKLLIEAGIMKKSDGTKNPKMPFNEYSLKFFDEIENNPKAKERLRELLKISKEKDVFLVCYEKDSNKCHRSLVKRILDFYK